MSRSGSKKNRESTAFLYERLSRDDNLEGDSYSVANQKKLLTNVAKELGYTNLVHFFDDGISGVTMNRPGFKEMIREIEKGIRVPKFMDMADLKRHAGQRGYVVLSDRREAITQAIGIAESTDMVLIAGKGHEDYQIIGTRKFPFDDRVIAREALKLKWNGRNGS